MSPSPQNIHNNIQRVIQWKNEISNAEAQDRVKRFKQKKGSRNLIGIRPVKAAATRKTRRRHRRGHGTRKH